MITLTFRSWLNEIDHDDVLEQMSDDEDFMTTAWRLYQEYLESIEYMSGKFD